MVVPDAWGERPVEGVGVAFLEEGTGGEVDVLLLFLRDVVNVVSERGRTICKSRGSCERL